tara:strand:- start:1115 stop:1387 length:273 start_codon:yes stop_codon:yes gene_type:complete
MSSKRSVLRKIQVGAAVAPAGWEDFAPAVVETLAVEVVSVTPVPAVKVAIEAFCDKYPKSTEVKAARTAPRQSTRKTTARKKTTKSQKSS